MNGELLTIEDVGRFLKVKPSTVRTWSNLGLIPCIRLGGKLIRFKENDIEEWLENSTIEGARKK